MRTIGHPIYRWRVLALPHADAHTVRRYGTLQGAGASRLQPRRFLLLSIYTPVIVYR
jgi:hypothetical protein